MIWCHWKHCFHLLLVCLHPILIKCLDFPQFPFPGSLLFLVHLQNIKYNFIWCNLSSIPTFSHPNYFQNLKDHLFILLHCLSQIDNLAVLLLQHILKISHRRVRGRRCGRELLVYRRRRALEGLSVPGEEVESPSLLLVDAVAARKTVWLRSGSCWQVGEASSEKERRESRWFSLILWWWQMSIWTLLVRSITITITITTTITITITWTLLVRGIGSQPGFGTEECQPQSGGT